MKELRTPYRTNFGRSLLLSQTNFPEESIVMTRKPPKEKHHFVAINTVRLMLEEAVSQAGGEMKFLFTDAELRRRNLRLEIIPDAITYLVIDTTKYLFA